MIDPTTGDLDGLINDLTDGLGAHVVCEAVGKPSLVEQAIRLTRPRGNVQLVGVNPQGSMMPADLFDVHFRELSIRGAFGGGEAYRRALDLLPQVPSVERVVTSSYPLAQVSDPPLSVRRSGRSCRCEGGDQAKRLATQARAGMNLAAVSYGTAPNPVIPVKTGIWRHWSP